MSLNVLPTATPALTSTDGASPVRPRHLWSVPEDAGTPGTAPSSPAPEESPALAWQRLLGFLANGDADQGLAYERTRTRLVDFFSARGALNPQELADATFDRLVHKLTDADVVAVRSPIGYALRFARFIYLETVKAEVAQRQRLDSFEPEPRDEAAEAFEQREMRARLEVVEGCLSELPPADRALLLTYYQHVGSERIVARHELSRTLGISTGLLRTRVSRLRAELERRVLKRAAAAGLEP